QFKTRANPLQRALLLRIQFMRGRQVPRVKRILRRINRLLPTFQETVAQHPFYKSSRHLPKLQELRQRQRPPFCLQQFAPAFFSVLPLRLCFIFFLFFFLFFLVFFFLFFFICEFLSRQRAALPSDHTLRPALSPLHGLPNLNQPAPL